MIKFCIALLSEIRKEKTERYEKRTTPKGNSLSIYLHTCV